MANTARKTTTPVSRRKVTVALPAELLDGAMAMSGQGATETIRMALKVLRHRLACEGLLKARGTWKPSIDFNALRDAED